MGVKPRFFASYDAAMPVCGHEQSGQGHDIAHSVFENHLETNPVVIAPRTNERVGLEPRPSSWTATRRRSGSDRFSILG